jgi:hypothetical protein
MPDMDKISRGEAMALIKALGGGGGTGDVSDVQINGTSIVNGGVANVPVGNADTYGVYKVGVNNNRYGIKVEDGILKTVPASDDDIKKSNYYQTCLWHPIVPSTQHRSTFYGLARAAGADMASLTGDTVGTYPAAQKSAISTMLTAPETVTGTTPAITALPGVRYICGECSTLDITTPASGIVDIVFESGSTPTVLTVTPPTGMTMKWAGGFDPTALEANTTYEINVMDGVYAVVGSW